MKLIFAVCALLVFTGCSTHPSLFSSSQSDHVTALNVYRAGEMIVTAKFPSDSSSQALASLVGFQPSALEATNEADLILSGTKIVSGHFADQTSGAELASIVGFAPETNIPLSDSQYSQKGEVVVSGSFQATMTAESLAPIAGFVPLALQDCE